MKNVNPTSLFFGALVLAFLFFVTTRGDLGKWLGLLGLAPVRGAQAAGSDTRPLVPALPGSPATLDRAGALGIMNGFPAGVSANVGSFGLG